MEIEDSRDTANILETCALIENLRAETYDLLAEAYRDDPKVSALFHKTANEERNHEYQFLMALRKFLPAITGSALEVESVGKYARFARESLENVRKEIPSIEDAIKMSILSETAFRQFHMDTAVFFEDTSLASLFRAMMAGDEDHVESLKRAYSELTGKCVSLSLMDNQVSAG